MKLSIKLSILLLLIIQNTQAQEGFRIGPTGSYFFSKPTQLDSLPNQFNFRYKSGFNAGVSMYYGFSPRFGIAANVLFTYKGYRIYNDSNKNGKTLKNNQSHLEIPIYLVFKQRFNTVSFVRENVGISISSMLSASKKEIKNDNGSYRIIEETKNTIYPMLHLGIEVGNENKAGNILLVGVNYNYAFKTNTKLGVYNTSNPQAAPYFNLGFKGGYIGVSFTYQFNLKNLKRQEEFFY